MKKIYIYFFQTQFKTGKTIRFLTHNNYNHVCISFEPNTSLLYSYSRYRYHEPFAAGFGIEYTDRYYGLDKMTNIKLCEYCVDDEHYDRIRNAVDYYVENQDKTKYNYLDIITYPFKKHIKLNLIHTCISFILELLERDDVYTIGQFEKSLSPESIIYEGPLDEFENGNPSRGNYDFYEKRSYRLVLTASALTLGGLCVSAVKKLMMTIL